jgi:DNA-directed RNA polymerase specialized sigma24 family protein
MSKSYARRDGPERAEAYRLRDQGLPVAEIALCLGVAESTCWRWMAARPPPEPPAARARRLLREALAALETA